MNHPLLNMRGIARIGCALLLPALLGACAHAIVIAPLQTPERSGQVLVQKNVAYVMTEADRDRQVTTEGGGGDKVSYFPYRDMEKAIRDVLRSIYQEVVVIRSVSDGAAIRENKVSLVFAPEVSTSSSSPSPFTWPPTEFTVTLSCNVTDPAGSTVARIRIVGNGTAEFSEFKHDFGLAGRRATDDMAKKLRQEIRTNSRLR